MGRQLIVMDDNSFLNGLFQSLTSSYCLKKLKPSGWKYMYPVVANFPSLPVNHIWMRWIFWFPLTTDDKLIGRRSDFIELNACFRWMKLKPIFWKTIRARGGHFHACRYKWSEQDLRFRLLPLPVSHLLQPISQDLKSVKTNFVSHSPVAIGSARQSLPLDFQLFRANSQRLYSLPIYLTLFFQLG